MATANKNKIKLGKRIIDSWYFTKRKSTTHLCHCKLRKICNLVEKNACPYSFDPDIKKLCEIPGWYAEWSVDEKGDSFTLLTSLCDKCWQNEIKKPREICSNYEKPIFDEYDENLWIRSLVPTNRASEFCFEEFCGSSQEPSYNYYMIYCPNIQYKLCELCFAARILQKN